MILKHSTSSDHKKSNTPCGLYIYTKPSLIHQKSRKWEEVGEKKDIENKIKLGN